MCFGYGGGLASISNEKEMDFVRNLSSKLRTDPVWIGLDWLIGFRKEHIYGAMGVLLTVLFPANGWVN